MLDRPLHLNEAAATTAVEKGIPDRERLLRFLAGRQFTYLEHEEEEEDLDEDGDQENYIQAKMGSLNLEQGSQHVGFNGRWNKKADTCYTWWVAGTLAVSLASLRSRHQFPMIRVDTMWLINCWQMLGVGATDLIDSMPSRRYLLEITQHQVGGFGKIAGAPPDIYHSYLGLAALAIIGEGGLKDFDVGLCCTKETTDKIAKARDGLVDSIRRDAADRWDDDGFWDVA